MSLSDRMRMQAAAKAAEMNRASRTVTHLQAVKEKSGKRTPLDPEVAAQKRGALTALGASMRETASQVDSSRYFVVADMYNMRCLADMMSDAKFVSLDLETTGLNHRKGKICGMSVSIQEGEAYYLPLYHPLDREYCLPEREVAALVKPILENPAIHIVGANLTNFDAKWWLHHWHADLSEPIDDVQIMYNLLDPRSKEELKLKLLVMVRLGIRMQTFDETVGYTIENGERVMLTYDKVPLDQSFPYACADGDMALRLRHNLADELSSIPRWILPDGTTEGTFLDYYYDLEDGTARAIRDMEDTGILLDPEVLEVADERIGHFMEEREAKIYPQIGAPINIRSPQQLAFYLHGTGQKTFDVEIKQAELDKRPKEWQELWLKYRRADEMTGNKPKKNYKIPLVVQGLGLKVMRKSKKTGGPSTDKEALDLLADEYPEMWVLDDIAVWKKLATLKSNFTTKLIEFVDPDTGRVHMSLNQTGVETGRFSCSSPNLQQLPKPKEEINDEAAEYGAYIRAAFIAPPGFIEVEPTLGWMMLYNYEKDGKYPARELLKLELIPLTNKMRVPIKYLCFCDFSQIELRVAAFYSGDEGMRYAYTHDIDIHTMTSSQMNDVPLDKVTKDMRRAAKALNFGIWFGMIDKTLARRLKIPLIEASQKYHAYLTAYKGVKEYARQSAEFARSHDGGIQTMLGRWRWTGIKGLVSSSNKWDRSGAERKCMNTPIQGSAAEIMKEAMMNIHQNLVDRGRFDLLVNVHDELGNEIASEYMDPLHAAHLIQGHMELKMGTFSIPEGFDIPIEADPAVGLSWGKMFEAKKLVAEYRKLIGYAS